MVGKYLSNSITLIVCFGLVLASGLLVAEKYSKADLVLEYSFHLLVAGLAISVLLQFKKHK